MAKNVREKRVQQVGFDEKARFEFITGFRKRKQEKKKQKQKNRELREKKERSDLRKESRAQMTELYAQVNEIEAINQPQNDAKTTVFTTNSKKTTVSIS